MNILEILTPEYDRKVLASHRKDAELSPRMREILLDTSIDERVFDSLARQR